MEYIVFSYIYNIFHMDKLQSLLFGYFHYD